jgi:hypothetical protein
MDVTIIVLTVLINFSVSVINYNILEYNFIFNSFLTNCDNMKTI